MSNCDTCHREAMSLHMCEGMPGWHCTDCYTKPPSRINFKNQVTLKNGAVIGAGHLEDITRRKKAPDGSIYRDYGRKYI